MRSQYADEFNHDDQALEYDEHVRDESNPIRAGYSRLLDWTAAEANVGATSSVLELGAGTGNLAQRIVRCRRMVCVDISAGMLRVARDKLAAFEHIEYVQSELLEYANHSGERFDAIVSTYAIHHLTDEEKSVLFRAVADRLELGGTAVFGDLMFENARSRRRYLAQLRAAGDMALAHEIESEFFWDVERAVADLAAAGLRIKVEQFSEFYWGLAARARATE